MPPAPPSPTQLERDVLIGLIRRDAVPPRACTWHQVRVCKRPNSSLLQLSPAYSKASITYLDTIAAVGITGEDYLPRLLGKKNLIIHFITAGREWRRGGGKGGSRAQEKLGVHFLLHGDSVSEAEGFAITAERATPGDPCAILGHLAKRHRGPSGKMSPGHAFGLRSFVQIPRRRRDGRPSEGEGHRAGYGGGVASPVSLFFFSSLAFCICYFLSLCLCLLTLLLHLSFSLYCSIPPKFLPISLPTSLSPSPLLPYLSPNLPLPFFSLLPHFYLSKRPSTPAPPSPDPR